ncbi:hypothetical protein BC830DRAFT_1168046 [Chytriomyces sp. MP71]|nr:hypothetical protein BC830DRAFT_1168046 [Chytriomyces sp. MP71]
MEPTLPKRSYATKSNRGRKLDENQPVSEKAAQKRAVQRNFRERRLAHIAQLEKSAAEFTEILRLKNEEVASLKQALVLAQTENRNLREMLNSGAGRNPHSVNADYQANLFGIDDELSNLLFGSEPSPTPPQPAAPPPPHSTPAFSPPYAALASVTTSIPASPTAMDEWSDLLNASPRSTNLDTPQFQLHPSAEELYGPAKVEFLRSHFKSIRPLTSSRLPDSMINMFVELTHARERMKALRCMLRMVWRWYMIIALCRDPADRALAIEGWTVMQGINRSHLDHALVLSGSMEMADVSTVAEEVVLTSPVALESNRKLKAMTCFQAMGSIVDKLCAVFCGPPKTAVDFLQIGVFVRMLHVACITLDEQTQLYGLVMEMGSNMVNPSALDEAIEDLEKLTM